MRFAIPIIAVVMLGVGFAAMSQSYSHPGAVASADEAASVYGARCYLPQGTATYVCSGGNFSDCLGCGCTLGYWPQIAIDGGAQGEVKICEFDGQCTYDDVDLSVYCPGPTGGGGGPPPPGGT